MDPRTRSQTILHILAWLTALAVFPLVWMGGLVTSHGAGMSVPDWPTSFGYNMFALPWEKWLGPYSGGVFFEHSHRLLGTVVGMLAIALTVAAWFTARRRWIAWMASGLLLAVCVQGVAGGLRVNEVSLLLAKLHGILGQLVFAYAGVMVVVTSSWWMRIASRFEAIRLSPVAVRQVLLANGVLITLILVQLTLGAFMRHDPDRDPVRATGASLAIPDWPLHYGKLLPPVSSDGLTQINAQRAFELHMPPVSMAQVWLNFSHRLGAYCTVLAALVLVGLIWKRTVGGAGLRGLALLLMLLIITQATLGVLTILWNKPADIATAHQACGATLLTIAVALFSRGLRLSHLARREFRVSARSETLKIVADRSGALAVPPAAANLPRSVIS